jgi:hypothetical protein
MYTALDGAVRLFVALRWGEKKRGIDDGIVKWAVVSSVSRPSTAAAAATKKKFDVRGDEKKKKGQTV